MTHHDQANQLPLLDSCHLRPREPRVLLEKRVTGIGRREEWGLLQAWWRYSFFKGMPSSCFKQPSLLLPHNPCFPPPGPFKRAPPVWAFLKRGQQGSGEGGEGGSGNAWPWWKGEGRPFLRDGPNTSIAITQPTPSLSSSSSILVVPLSREPRQGGLLEGRGGRVTGTERGG